MCVSDDCPKRGKQRCNYEIHKNANRSIMAEDILVYFV